MCMTSWYAINCQHYKLWRMLSKTQSSVPSACPFITSLSVDVQQTWRTIQVWDKDTRRHADKIVLADYNISNWSSVYLTYKPCINLTELGVMSFISSMILLFFFTSKVFRYTIITCSLKCNNCSKVRIQFPKKQNECRMVCVTYSRSILAYIWQVLLFSRKSLDCYRAHLRSFHIYSTVAYFFFIILTHH